MNGCRQQMTTFPLGKSSAIHLLALFGPCAKDPLARGVLLCIVIDVNVIIQTGSSSLHVNGHGQ